MLYLLGLFAALCSTADAYHSGTGVTSDQVIGCPGAFNAVFDGCDCNEACLEHYEEFCWCPEAIQCCQPIRQQYFGSGVSARKDPHLSFAHGGRADFRGEDEAVFNFLSARNVSLNLKTVLSDFKWKDRLVHGTKISAAYWTIRSAHSGRVINVEFDVKEPWRAMIKQMQGHNAVQSWLRAGAEVMVLDDDISAKLSKRSLVVTVAHKWAMTATANTFPFASLNPNQTLLDISVNPLYDADHDPVAPHGLFGQSFDGDEIDFDGKVDSRSGAETTTDAQAEGAIEGTMVDYKINASNPFSTEFKFSRFDAVQAAPRDTSKLKGIRRPKKAIGSASASHVQES